MGKKKKKKKDLAAIAELFMAQALFCPRVLPKVTTQWHCPHLCSENNTLLVNIENILKSQRLNIGKTE